MARRWLVALAVVVLASVAATAVGLTDDGSQQDRFGVIFHPPSPDGSHPAANAGSGEVWEPMALANGTRYQCRIPGPELVASDEASKAAEAKRKKKSEPGTELDADTARALHRALSGQCAVKAGGWWVYDACWNQGVRQYHPDRNQQIETEYSLGQGPAKKIKKGATGTLFYGRSALHGLYVATHYHNGTVCDLSGQERSTELRLLCDDGTGANGAEVVDPGREAELQLTDITEPETCTYVVWLKHPAVCDVPELRKAPQVVRPIDCYQLPADPPPLQSLGNDALPTKDAPRSKQSD